jgi:hypothetical protein
MRSKPEVASTWFPGADWADVGGTGLKLGQTRLQLTRGKIAGGPEQDDHYQFPAQLSRRSPISAEVSNCINASECTSAKLNARQRVG